VFVLFAWQAITTAGRQGPLDAGEYLLNAQYLDQHGWLPPTYVSYEYSAPPLYEFLAVGAEHVVRALPSLPLELPSNLATRLLWLCLVVVSVFCLTTGRTRTRRIGIAGLVLGGLWALDEAISLGRTERWSSGQLLALAAALGLVVVSGLIAREIWPGHPGRALATAGFVMAYPVVLRLGALFHPETAMAFLSALVIWIVIRAERRGWSVRLGIAAGVLCGLDALTRQSAVVVFACALLVAIWVGRRAARGFTLALVVAAVLVAGPWLGYAAYTWGNPLQGNLHRPGGMVTGGEPRSFYVSFPVRSIVLHPYREDFANQLLPQLHADLWSDWFGAFHAGAWSDASRVDRVTASSQSILGFAGDALALGGLAAFGIPALLRLARRRSRPTDAALGLLALVAIVGFAAFSAQIVRYPQLGGKEIKASYLMFAAPGFAVFSVASWLAIVRWRRWAGAALVALASLYVVSYGTSLASALSHRYDPRLDLTAPAGYVDLQLAMPPPPGNTWLNGDKNLELTVTNAGGATAEGVELVVHLDPGMKLLGEPYSVRGTGCTGTHTLRCNLDFLESHMSTPIRFSVKLTRSGQERIDGAVTSSGLDANPADNSAVLIFVVP
jgi:Dolichyl-phosphate-mannose-protein mannosyltransferase/Domain of unknown function DUF11